MNRIQFFVILLFFSVNLFGQTSEKFKDGNEFNSVFQNLESGSYKGTTNGILMLSNLKGNENILDFQGSFGKLEIKKDEYEVYDISTKIYIGRTTSGKTEIKYETYGSANSIGIYLARQWYELTAIDGACDMVLNGIEYYYRAEKSTEYLIITISKELELSNWQFLLRTEHTMEPDNINELKPKKKTINILPNSTIVFAINRKSNNPKF